MVAEKGMDDDFTYFDKKFSKLNWLYHETSHYNQDGLKIYKNKEAIRVCILLLIAAILTFCYYMAPNILNMDLPIPPFGQNLISNTYVKTELLSLENKL